MLGSAATHTLVTKITASKRMKIQRQVRNEAVLMWSVTIITMWGWWRTTVKLEDGHLAVFVLRYSFRFADRLDPGILLFLPFMFLSSSVFRSQTKERQKDEWQKGGIT